MSALSVQVPFPVFQDRDGQPLENGYVWIGTANLYPITNAVPVFFDAALTIPAAQPLRTINGYISNAGTPAQVYVNGANYSILVQDSKGSMVYNFPDGTGISPDACGVTYTPPFANAVAYPVCEKLEQTVSVKDFGAVGDGAADDTVEIQAALNAVAAAGGGDLFIPEGIYLHSGITVPATVNLTGFGAKSSILRYTNTTGNGVNLLGSLHVITGIKVDCPSGSSGAAIAGNSNSAVSDLYIDQYEIEGFTNGIYIPFGVNAYIGVGRLIGRGKTVVGGIGLQLGDRDGVPARLVNVAQVTGCYSSAFETNFKMHNSVSEMHNIISENCINAIEAESRLLISSSWVQADTYLLRLTDQFPVAFHVSYFLNAASVEQDDITGMVELTGGATINNVGVLGHRGFNGIGRWSFRFASDANRAVQFGADTDGPYAYATNQTLNVESLLAPLRLNRDAGAGLLGLAVGSRQSSDKWRIGLDSSDRFAVQTSTSSAALFVVDPVTGSVICNNNAIATTATAGFLYIPSCAGTPTGTPSTEVGRVPLVVDSTNHKLYFFSGGTWRDAGP